MKDGGEHSKNEHRPEILKEYLSLHVEARCQHNWREAEIEEQVRIKAHLLIELSVATLVNNEGDPAGDNQDKGCLMTERDPQLL